MNLRRDSHTEYLPSDGLSTKGFVTAMSSYSMRSKTPLFALVLPALVLFALLAPEPTTTLHGFVVDDHGQPIAGIPTTLEWGSNGKSTVITDADGRFVLPFPERNRGLGRLYANDDIWGTSSLMVDLSLRVSPIRVQFVPRAKIRCRLRGSFSQLWIDRLNPKGEASASLLVRSSSEPGFVISEPVSPGTYRVTARTHGSSHLRDDINVTDNLSTFPIELLEENTKPTPKREVRVRVFLNGDPLRNSRVEYQIWADSFLGQRFKRGMLRTDVEGWGILSSRLAHFARWGAFGIGTGRWVQLEFARGLPLSLEVHLGDSMPPGQTDVSFVEARNDSRDHFIEFEETFAADPVEWLEDLESNAPHFLRDEFGVPLRGTEVRVGSQATYSDSDAQVRLGRFGYATIARFPMIYVAKSAELPDSKTLETQSSILQLDSEAIVPVSHPGLSLRIPQGAGASDEVHGKILLRTAGREAWITGEAPIRDSASYTAISLESGDQLREVIVFGVDRAFSEQVWFGRGSAEQLAVSSLAPKTFLRSEAPSYLCQVDGIEVVPPDLRHEFGDLGRKLLARSSKGFSVDEEGSLIPWGPARWIDPLEPVKENVRRFVRWREFAWVRDRVGVVRPLILSDGKAKVLQFEGEELLPPFEHLPPTRRTSQPPR